MNKNYALISFDSAGDVVNEGLLTTDAPTDLLFSLWSEICEDEDSEDKCEQLVEQVISSGYHAIIVEVDDTIYP